MGVFAFGYDAGGRKYVRISHQKDFYQSTQYLYENGKLVKIDVPADADPYLVRSQIVVFVRTPWQVGRHGRGARARSSRCPWTTSLPARRTFGW